MLTRSSTFAGLFLLTFGVLLGQAQEAISVTDSPIRTWTSADGKFSVSARLVEIAADKVALLREDGKRVSVRADQLSTEDRNFVQSEQQRASATSPFVVEPTEARPFGAIMPIGSNSGGLSQVQPIDLSSDAELDLNSAIWQAPERKKIAPFKVNALSFAARATNCVSTPDDSIFAVSFYDPFGGKRGSNPPSWVTLVDLSSRKTIGQFPLEEEHTVVGDLNSDGTLLLTYNEALARNSKLALFRLQSGTLVPVSSWDPGSAAGHFDDVRAARFLANGDVVVEHLDQLTVWQPDPPTAKFTIAKQGFDWQLAPDRRHAVVSQFGKKYEVDLIEGRCTASSGSSSQRLSERVAEAKSPDRSRVAALQNGTMTLRSESGQELDSFYVPITWPDVAMTWVDDRFLQIDSPNRTFFVDTRNRVAIAETLSFGVREEKNGWLTSSDRGANSNMLLVTQAQTQSTPAPELIKLANQLPAQGDDLLIFVPGQEVQLDIQFTADQNLLPTARKSIEAMVAERNMKIVPSSPWVLQARCSSHSETVEYRMMGASPLRGGNNVETVNVTNTIHSLQLLKNGDVLWSRSTSHGPGFVLHINQGESAQQAANRAASGRSGFWDSISLPTHVAAHRNGGAWFRVGD